MIPAQFVGGRAADDAHLRRRLVLSARAATAAAAAVLAAGFLLVATGTEPVDASFHAGATPPSAPTPSATADNRPVDLTPKGTASSPVVWQLHPTGNRAKDAAIAGYRNYFGTAVRLGEDPDPADPALAEVALDPELGRLRRALSVSSDAQLSRRGRVSVVAWLLSLQGSQAVVVGCANSSAQQMYDGAQQRTAWRGGVVVTAARLVLQGGSWRVYQINPMSRSRCLR